MRLEGATYEEIARAGGGIRSTVAATREASEADLVAGARPRLDRMAQEGVTTVEIKSGYGLERDAELRMLCAARQLGRDTPVDVVTSFLGAHAVPPEYDGRQREYIDLVVEEMLPSVAAQGLADAVDGFCETIGFTPGETALLFDAAKRHDLPVKLHADQLSDLGGAAMAARYGALSADHLEYTSDEGVAAMAAAGTVAVLLPGAYFVLAGNQTAAGPGVSSARRRYGRCHRLQPGLGAGGFAVAHAQYGLHPVSYDAGRGIGRRDPQCRPRARPGRRPRRPGGRHARRFGDLGHYATGGAELLARRQPLRRRGEGRCPVVSETYDFHGGDLPLLISIPHLGSRIPDDIAARMTAAGRLSADTDWHLDRLYDFAYESGASVLQALYSRYVVDLNRDPDGTPLYPGADNTEICPTSSFDSEPLYQAGQAPDEAEVANRIATYWRPYHDRLSKTLADLRSRHDRVVLFEAHSIRSHVPRFFDGQLPDFNLGTGAGVTADDDLVAEMMAVLAAADEYTHVLNGRFKGGYNTRHYADPAGGIHAVQLEQAQCSYMAETPPFDYLPDLAAQVQPTLRRLVAAMIDWATGAAPVP